MLVAAAAAADARPPAKTVPRSTNRLGRFVWCSARRLRRRPKLTCAQPAAAAADNKQSRAERTGRDQPTNGLGGRGASPLPSTIKNTHTRRETWQRANANAQAKANANVNSNSNADANSDSHSHSARRRRLLERAARRCESCERPLRASRRSQRAAAAAQATARSQLNRATRPTATAAAAAEGI